MTEERISLRQTCNLFCRDTELSHCGYYVICPCRGLGSLSCLGPLLASPLSSSCWRNAGECFWRGFRMREPMPLLPSSLLHRYHPMPAFCHMIHPAYPAGESTTAVAECLSRLRANIHRTCLQSHHSNRTSVIQSRVSDRTSVGDIASVIQTVYIRKGTISIRHDVPLPPANLTPAQASAPVFIMLAIPGSCLYLPSC
jgi:hypothetical protein